MRSASRAQQGSGAKEPTHRVGAVESGLCFEGYRQPEEAPQHTDAVWSASLGSIEGRRFVRRRFFCGPQRFAASSFRLSLPTSTSRSHALPAALPSCMATIPIIQ